MNEISLWTVTGWFKDPEQRMCVVRKWLNAIAFSAKPQWSTRYWADTLEALDVMQDYSSVCEILDDFVRTMQAAEVRAAAANAAIGAGGDKGGAPAGPPSKKDSRGFRSGVFLRR